jgi:hypothetical protein
MGVGFTITGIQEAQAMNNRAIAALRPTGALGRAVQYGTIAAHRYALGLTHVDTGALKSSHRMELSGTRGRIYIDPSTSNPRTGQAPVEYGVIEHNRGGSHAFYARVVAEHGTEIETEMERMVRGGIP